MASAPCKRTSSSGPSTLPFDFDIFVPPCSTQPWWKTLANGSRKPTSPISFMTFTKNREYRRWPVEWSMPPMYCEIGHQKSAAARSNGATSECGST